MGLLTWVRATALAVLLATGLGSTGCSTTLGPSPTPAPTDGGAGAAPRPAPTSTTPPAPQETFDLSPHSTDRAASLWVVVNEQRPLRPVGYVPELTQVEGYQVDPRIADGLRDLLREGRRAGLDLRIMSAYRSFGYQSALFAARVTELGEAGARRVVALPGHSEHQTGLAVDFGRRSTGECNVQPCFAETAEGRWLQRHAWQYGFLLRYPEGAARITGYSAESWHYRFVGRPLAAHLRREGIATLERAFGL
jgi:D-alanyl-D-alanine carboxypeptidase